MTKFFNANEGLHGRQGGPFLDDVQRRQQEEVRAVREGREPDYENMQPAVGDPLVTEEQLLQQSIQSAEPYELTNFEGVTAAPLVEVDIPEETEDEEVNEDDEPVNTDNSGEVPPPPEDPKF